MKTIGITGGTGFVGKHLTELLLAQNHQVIIFSRKPATSSIAGVRYAHWDAEQKTCDTHALNQLDAIVHLAGAGIADKRWTDSRKKEIVNSRVDGTHFLVEQIKLHAPDCQTLISASATGFYGPDMPGKPPFSESAKPYADFLGNTCKAWEDAAHGADAALRTVILRFGIVLGQESGAFPQFERPMNFGIMPILGNGTQMVSWIEVDDLARLILFCIDNVQCRGVYNAVSPNPVTHVDLMRTIAAIKGGLKIPVPAPAFALKIMLGEMSVEVLKSCTVSAQKTLATGFSFRYPEISGAVKAILNKQ